MKLYIVFLLALTLSGCDLGSEPEPQILTDLVIVSGDGQTGRVNTTLPLPLVVRVDDEAGDPVSGVRIGWMIDVGSGSVSSPLTRTGSGGTSSVTWTLGNAPGVAGVTAFISEPGGEDITISFGATVEP